MAACVSLAPKDPGASCECPTDACRRLKIQTHKVGIVATAFLKGLIPAHRWREPGFGSIPGAGRLGWHAGPSFPAPDFRNDFDRGPPGHLHTPTHLGRGLPNPIAVLGTSHGLEFISDMKVASLFSGAGALDLGLHQVGSPGRAGSSSRRDEALPPQPSSWLADRARAFHSPYFEPGRA